MEQLRERPLIEVPEENEEGVVTNTSSDGISNSSSPLYPHLSPPASLNDDLFSPVPIGDLSYLEEKEKKV